MIMHEKEARLAGLFSTQGSKLDNMKFFRGSEAVINEDKFRSELCSSVERSRETGVQKSRKAPRCKKPAVDLKALVAAM